MTDIIKTELTSQLQNVTVYLNGAEVSRIADLSLERGDFDVRIKDLPDDADPQSIRVEGQADGKMTIGLVDSRREAVPLSDHHLTKAARRELEQQIEALEDSSQQILVRIKTLKTQKQLIENLALLPLQSGSDQAPTSEKDWTKIYDLIGERLTNANEIIFKAQLEQRALAKKIKDLKQKLTQKPPRQHYVTVVSVRLTAEEVVKGQLKIHYRVANARWKPFYDIRLTTEQEAERSVATTNNKDKGGLVIERRAEISQNSGEVWEDVNLTLSTTHPSYSTSAPKLFPHQLDPSPVMYAGAADSMADQAAPMARVMMKTAAVSQKDKEQVQNTSVEAEERESESAQSAHQTLFSVPDRTTVNNRREPVKVYLSAVQEKPDLFLYTVPKQDLHAYLYAKFRWGDPVSLLPGSAWLYRDGVFVGKGEVTLVNEGEICELGFGVDDKVKVSWREMNRITGNRGLIKSHNMDERDFQITVENLHDYEIKAQIIDQIPFANDEKIEVDILPDSTSWADQDMKGQRGILLWKQDIAAKDTFEIRLHYKVSWPKGSSIIL